MHTLLSLRILSLYELWRGPVFCLHSPTVMYSPSSVFWNLVLNLELLSLMSLKLTVAVKRCWNGTCLHFTLERLVVLYWIPSSEYVLTFTSRRCSYLVCMPPNGRRMNDELVRFGRKQSWRIRGAYSPTICLKGLMQQANFLSQNRRCSGRDSNINHTSTHLEHSRWWVFSLSGSRVDLTWTLEETSVNYGGKLWWD
jgi:hypothetical protein